MPLPAHLADVMFDISQDPGIMKLLSLSLFAALVVAAQLQTVDAQTKIADWTIDSAEEWTQNIETAEGASVADGSVSPNGKAAQIATKIHASEVKRSAKSLVVTQSTIWQNWNPIKNLGPSNLGDAPVMLTVGPDNYWMFGRYNRPKNRKKKGKKAKQDSKTESKPKAPFEPQDATLAGFDIPLKTTCLLYTSPSPRDATLSRMPSSA